MTPTVALAGPQKTLAAVDPFDGTARDSGLVPIDVAPRDVYPRIIFFDEHRAHFAGTNIAQHERVRILSAVELLSDHLVGISGPFHARQVVVARIARNFHPLRRAAIGVHDADARRGVHLAGFRIWKRLRDGIKT